MQKERVKLIARIFTDNGNHRLFPSEFAKMGINFNFVKVHAEKDKLPQFCSEWDKPKNKTDLDNIVIAGYFRQEDFIRDRHDPIFGFEKIISAFSEVDETKAALLVKNVRYIKRKMESLALNNKMPKSLLDVYQQIPKRTFASFAMSILFSLDIKTVLFEELSERNKVTKWKEYPLIEIPELVAKGCNMLAQQRNWA